MPITQSRMLSLLGAAQDYQRGLTRLIELIEEQRFKLDNGQTTAGSALATIALSANTLSLMQRPVDSQVVIKLEAVHFAREGRRNAQKTAKARENRLYEISGLPKPQRGNGRTISRAASQQINPVVRAEPNTTAPGRDFVGEVEIGKSGDYEAGPHASEWVRRAEAHRRAQGIEDITAETDLSFDEPEIPYIPQPISEEQKVKIAEFNREQEAAARFIVQPGYAKAEAFCDHTFSDSGEPCQICGKVMESAEG